MSKDAFLESCMEQTFVAPFAFVITDVDGKVIWANPAFHDLCGYELEEMVGRKPGDFLQGPATDPRAAAELREAIRRGEYCRSTLLNYHKCGRTYQCQVDLNPVRDEEGRLIYFCAIDRDVTAETLNPWPTEAMVLTA